MRTVNYAILLAIALLAGCENTSTRNETSTAKYTKISVTDPSGDLISEWIAEGPVKKADQGYTIHAVERRTPGPYPTDSQYPNGRMSSVVGPNIVLKDIEKPDWLKKLDEKKP